MKRVILIIAFLVLSLPAAAQRGASVGEIVGGAAPTAPYTTGLGQVVSPAGTSPLSEKESKPEKGLVTPYPTGGAELQTAPEKSPGSYYGPEVKSSGQYYPSDVKTDGRYVSPGLTTTPEASPAPQALPEGAPAPAK